MARKKFIRKEAADRQQEAGESIAPENTFTTPEAPTDCPLCGRPLAEPMNRHHLIPVSRGGRHTPTVMLHKICHNKIHAVLSEKELKRRYNTIEALQSQPDIAKFIGWVQRKDPHFYDSSVKSRVA